MDLKQFFFLAAFLLIYLPSTNAEKISSSPTYLGKGDQAYRSALANPSNVITFSEYPVNTVITDQYSDKGVLFSGSSVFITSDGSNPTSPVLSGTPRFEGEISGVFVNAGDGVTPVAVSKFSVDAGYIDSIGSVRLSWFSLDGSKIGQKIVSLVGIETLIIDEGEIASWRIETIEDEPSGFAIDNLSIEPLGATLIFREQKESSGFWGRFNDEIPGFDHVGMHLNNLVYESNVKYDQGEYVNQDGTDFVTNKNDESSNNGVQYYHKKGIFEWNALRGEASKVTEVANIAISQNVAEKMKGHILSQKSAPFFYLPSDGGKIDLEGLIPSLQKGGGTNGGFTCVGLLEWSAEESGHQGGEGFIPDDFESLSYPVFDDVEISWPPVSLRKKTIGLLSPQLMYWASSGRIKNAHKAVDYLQGFFDPVDFILTDPLGRRLGYSDSTGLLEEIPGAMYSKDGLYEQFLLVDPIPGLYELTLLGLNDDASFALESSNHSFGVQDLYLKRNEEKKSFFVVEVSKSGAGDVNGDGKVDAKDSTLLKAKAPTFTGSSGDPSDLNRDGILNDVDIALLNNLIKVVNKKHPAQRSSGTQEIPVLPFGWMVLMALLLLLVKNRNRVEM